MPAGRVICERVSAVTVKGNKTSRLLPWEEKGRRQGGDKGGARLFACSRVSWATTKGNKSGRLLPCARAKKGCGIAPCRYNAIGPSSALKELGPIIDCDLVAYGLEFSGGTTR